MRRSQYRSSPPEMMIWPPPIFKKKRKSNIPSESSTRFVAVNLIGTHMSIGMYSTLPKKVSEPSASGSSIFVPPKYIRPVNPFEELIYYDSEFGLIMKERLIDMHACQALRNGVISDKHDSWRSKESIEIRAAESRFEQERRRIEYERPQPAPFVNDLGFIINDPRAGYSISFGHEFLLRDLMKFPGVFDASILDPNGDSLLLRAKPGKHGWHTRCEDFFGTYESSKEHKLLEYYPLLLSQHGLNPFHHCHHLERIRKYILPFLKGNREENCVVKDLDYFTHSRARLELGDISFAYTRSVDIPNVFHKTFKRAYYPSNCTDEEAKKMYLYERYMEQSKQCDAITRNLRKIKEIEPDIDVLYKYHEKGLHIHGFFKFSEFPSKNSGPKRCIVDVFNFMVFPIFEDYEIWDPRLKYAFDRVTSFNLKLETILLENSVLQRESYRFLLSRPYKQLEMYEPGLKHALFEYQQTEYRKCPSIVGTVTTLIREINVKKIGFVHLEIFYEKPRFRPPPWGPYGRNYLEDKIREYESLKYPNCGLLGSQVMKVPKINKKGSNFNKTDEIEEHRQAEQCCVMHRVQRDISSKCQDEETEKPENCAIEESITTHSEESKSGDHEEVVVEPQEKVDDMNRRDMDVECSEESLKNHLDKQANCESRLSIADGVEAAELQEEPAEKLMLTTSGKEPIEDVEQNEDGEEIHEPSPKTCSNSNSIVEKRLNSETSTVDNVQIRVGIKIRRKRKGAHDSYEYSRAIPIFTGCEEQSSKELKCSLSPVGPRNCDEDEGKLAIGLNSATLEQNREKISVPETSQVLEVEAFVEEGDEEVRVHTDAQAQVQGQGEMNNNFEEQIREYQRAPEHMKTDDQLNVALETDPQRARQFFQNLFNPPIPFDERSMTRYEYAIRKQEHFRNLIELFEAEHAQLLSQFGKR